jgi:glycerophosphoryl diester phosphodiesterase
MHRNTVQDTVGIVAHRGASASAPENTLAAVRAAVTMNADLVELDVQRSRDGELVLIHDTDLSRTTNVRTVFPTRAPWHLADFTFAELRRLDAGSWKSEDYAGERIPALTEAIEVIRGSGSGLLLELKAPRLYPGVEADVVAAMRAHPGYVGSAVAAGRLSVQSFDVHSLRTYKELEPTVTIGLLGTPRTSRLRQLARWVDHVNPNHRRATAAYVAAVHEAGLECLVWTVDSVAAMRRAMRMQVDGIITNRPEVLERVIGNQLGTAA